MTHAPLDHLALRLPADAYHQLVHTLRLALPPPPGDAPEDLLRRDHAAIARIAALVPANAVEAELAGQFVAASELWKDCLRLAQQPETTPEWGAKCRSQALAMMRQANAALRLLLRLQQARAKREADNAGCDRAAWTEHCAVSLMAEALAQAAAPPQPETPDDRPAAVRKNSVGLVEDSPPRSAADWPAPRLGAVETEHETLVRPGRAAPTGAIGRAPDRAVSDPPDEVVAHVLAASGVRHRLVTRSGVSSSGQ